MSRYSQGVSDRELLNRPCSPGVLVAAGDDLVADPLQLAQAEVAAVLDDELEPAGRAQPLDRRGAERRHDGPADLVAGSALAARAAMASADWSGPVRSANALSMTYIEPRFGALAFRISDWPEMPTVCVDPGRVAGGLLDRGPSSAASARTDAESGSWTLRSR